MMHTVGKPSFIVVDIRDVIKEFASYSHQYPLYNRFPLSDMIEVILKTNAYIDNGEYLWDETDKRCNGNLHAPVFLIDFDVLAMFYDTLTECLDFSIASKLPNNLDTGEFVFHKWVNPTTVMLEYDDNAKSCCGILQDGNGKSSNIFGSSSF